MSEAQAKLKAILSFQAEKFKKGAEQAKKATHKLKQKLLEVNTKLIAFKTKIDNAKKALAGLGMVAQTVKKVVMGLLVVLTAGIAALIAIGIKSVKTLLGKVNDNTIIVPGHGPLSDKAQYEDFLAMIEETKAFVEKHKADGKTAEDIVATGLPDKWKSWSWSFINEEKWINTLYNG